MIDKVNEQLKKAMQPIEDLVSANTQALEKLASQQAELFTGLFEDSISFAQGATELRDLEGLVEAQKAYASEVQEKITTAAKDAYDVISEAQQKAGEVLQQAASDAQEAVSSLTK